VNKHTLDAVTRVMLAEKWGKQTCTCTVL